MDLGSAINWSYTVIVVYLLAQGVHNAEEVLEKINIELGRQEQG